MTFDHLNEPLSTTAWGEQAALAGFSEFWDRELFGLAVPAWRQNVVKWVERFYHAGDGRPIVVGDMGCGAALYARHLLAAGVPFEYHGYDHNAAVLEAACRRWQFLPHENLHLHLLDARSPHWPLDDRTLDVVIWDTTLRFCDDPASALAESLRICREWVLLARTPLEQRCWSEDVRYYGMNSASRNWHFDSAFFEERASTSGWHFAPCAGDEELHILSAAPLPAEVRIRPTSNLARVFHAAYVRERIASLLNGSGGPWGLYGAGRHSRWLLGTLPPELTRRFVCLIDDAGAPGQQVAGLPVRTPPQARMNKLAGVIVSSDTIEHELFAAAQREFGASVPIHRLYAELPPGPYDKPSGGAAPAITCTHTGSGAGRSGQPAVRAVSSAAWT